MHLKTCFDDHKGFSRKLSGGFIGAFLAMLAGCTAETSQNASEVAAMPGIWPDYIGVTVPRNIAPLNFNMADSALAMDVSIQGADGTVIRSQGSEASGISIRQWHKLLDQNSGDSVMVTVAAKYADGWRQYRPFPIYVSHDSIDYGLTYRLIAPGYEVYSKMGIYERNLSNYDEKAILENTQVDGCMNCHAYNQCDPDWYSMHVRGSHGATLLRKDGEMAVYDTSTDATLGLCVYPYWHPSGRYIAYSTNNTRQGFHISGKKRLEVFDYASDVQAYDTETGQLLAPAILKRDSVWETFPAFSPDGASLYFCAAAPQEIPQGLDQVRYDLLKISFDPATGRFGQEIDTVIHASAMGKSVSWPKPSFDGKHLAYTLSDYGNFSIWHPESDIHILDLATGESKPMALANSEDADSYHNWSSNSRWMVIGSRRDDGWHTRAYICHVDDEGNASKPFLLPQENPRRYYDQQYRSYNIPEFVKRPVDLDKFEAERILTSPDRIKMKVKGREE
ncbi:MAG: hypothetical protein LUD17_12215 [Bacteroidales bacterium]|nr:hypothetical protein [Bacteroidales bacterium]